MDSRFREIHVPRKMRKLLCLFWVGRSPTLPFASYLSSLLWRKGEEDFFPQKYVYVLRTTTTPHMVSFINFYFHFLANFSHLNFASYVLYVYPCYVTWPFGATTVSLFLPSFLLSFFPSLYACLLHCLLAFLLVFLLAFLLACFLSFIN